MTKFGEQSATTYLDPRGQQIVTVDHAKLSVTDTAAAGGGGAQEATRAAVDAAVQAYVADHYASGESATYETDSGLVVCISAAKFSPGNFWNGRWRSTWTITLSGDEIAMEGKFQLLVHYYEDGNVQLNSEFTASVEVSGSTPEEVAEAVASEMEREESSYQSAVHESYAVMSERTFKGMRRKLPVTRSTMDWDKAASYSVGAELGGAS